MIEIRSDIEAIETNAALFDEVNFGSRADAIDTLEFKVINRLEDIRQMTHRPEELVSLKQQAERVKRLLEDVDDKLFQRLRTSIRIGDCSGAVFRVLIGDYVGHDANGGGNQQGEIGYDNLDLFINGLLLTQPAPTETKIREAEMVDYHQTPARIILELIETAHLAEKDVFYDLGSGLGQVAILVHLLSGVATKGIEFEPAYCDFARACAAELNLSRVEFINADARQADYSDGTVFFMYTPFAGAMLQAVLAKLRQEAQQRPIKLFTYGPCTLVVAQQNWLQSVNHNKTHIYKLGEFKSI